MPEHLMCELSVPGRVGFRFPEPDVPLAPLPEGLTREQLPLPEMAEVDVVRYFTRLSQLNHSVDTGFYPLGSCTMKYNPKINEEAARLPGFAHLHPLQPAEMAQGALEMMYQLQEWLKEIGGFAGVSLQPAAGAHGELTGVLIIRAYHESRGDTQRTKILIPDSAHGTNPATSAMSGMEVVELRSDGRGNVDLEALRPRCDDTLAGLMLTNPNTLGLFDENVEEVVRLVHAAGGLVYGDGANMNALLGIVRPGDLGIVEEGDEEEDLPPFYGFITPPRTIGRMKAFHGHFGMFVRAFTYTAMHGPQGLRAISDHAVLNANYLPARLRDTYHVP